MAKGCVSYAIETDSGAGWETKHRFRAQPQHLEAKFARHAAVVPKCVSVRLIEVRVVSQRDRRIQAQKMP